MAVKKPLISAISDFKSNLLVDYFLKFYDDKNPRGSGTSDFVDPIERSAFCREELGVSDLHLLPHRSRELKGLYERWYSKIVKTDRSHFLTNLTFEHFKEALFNYPERPIHLQKRLLTSIRLGDERASRKYNRARTVRHARQHGKKMPTETRTVMALNIRLPVAFQIDMESVNAHAENVPTKGSKQLSNSIVCITPESYTGSLPPKKSEMLAWHKRHRQHLNINRRYGDYFVIIIPGKTTKYSHRVNHKKGHFSYIIENMPGGSYNIFAAAGEFKTADGKSDFDNFDVNIHGRNTLINPIYGKGADEVAIVGGEVGNVTNLCGKKEI